LTGPREKRLALDEAARLAPNEWSEVEVRLLECSARGFRAACGASARVGARISLEIDGIGWVAAYVAWCRPGQFVATFEQPIDLARARFMALNREAVLARLLTERAAAHAAGKDEEERDLRSRILDGLPVRRIGGLTG
jgi:hypothetical protein